MHYYQFNIGDYRRDTAHLSPIEHYIYRSLLDWYYLEESPIPDETRSVMRRLGLANPSEEIALKDVLSDFFTLDEQRGGWVNGRADEVIESFHKQVVANRENGKKGGRPPKNKPIENPMGFDSEPNGNPSESEKNPNQEPITNNQGKTHTSADASESAKADPCPYEEIVGLYNDILPELPRVASLNERRKKNIQTRWREDRRHQSREFWEWFFSKVRENDWWMGRSGAWKIPNFDWLMNPTNFVKVIEHG